MIFFSFSLTCYPMVLKISKRYSSYKSQPKVFKLVLNFPPLVLTNCFEDFWNFEFAIFNYYFSKISNSPLYSMGNSKTSIILKTSDHRGKRSEIWGSGVVQWVYVQLLKLWPMAKFHLQIWQILKVSRNRCP